MEKFVGKWTEVSKDGFKAFAESLGVDDQQKAMYEQSKTHLEYQFDGCQWTMVIGVVGVPQSTQTYALQLGQTYSATDIDGRPMTSLINIEGDRFVEAHTFEKWPGVELGVERQVSGDSLIVTTSYKGSSLTTTFSRV